MSETFQNELPESNDEVRRLLYQGAIFLLPPNAASRELVDSVRTLVERELGEKIRRAHAEFSADDFFARVGRLRKTIYTLPEYHQLVNQVIQSSGFELGQQAYDPARLRVVTHNGHLNPAAAPIYYGHRDTWYANPQAMITWWLPLHDVTAAETFEFFPDEFSRLVANDSEIFDFDVWTARGQDNRIGWQNKETGRTAGYPSLQETPRGPRWPVVAAAGQRLLFSAQHLHQTCQNVTGLTRFSLDFRTVDLSDHAQGIEANNVDNRSTGSALGQFVRPLDSSLGSGQ